MQGSMDRRTGPYVKIRMQDPWTAKSVIIFRLGPLNWSVFLLACRNPWAAKLVRISKVGCRDPLTAKSVRIFRSGCRDPLTSKSIIILKLACRDPWTAKFVRIFNRDAKIHEPPNHMVFDRGWTGSSLHRSLHSLF